MGTVTERLQLLITASAKGVASEIRGVENASGDAATKTSLLTKAQQKLGIEGASTGTIMKTALAGGIAVGGAALAKFAAEGIQQFADLTGQVRGFQRVAGTSAEDSSKLVFAVKELGIEPDVAASAFGRLATRIGSNKTPLLDQAGLIERNKDGTVDLAGTVANLSDAYQKTEDPTKRAALANDAFGRSWQTLAPLLGKGKQDLQEIYAEAGKDHQIFSQADLERGRQYTIAIAQLSDAFTGLKVELGSALVPTVTSATQGITTGIQAADSATSAVGGLGGAVRIASDNINVYGAAVQGVNAVGDVFSGHFADAGKNALGAIPGVRGFSNAIFGSDEATNKFGDAQKRAQDATTNLANVLADHNHTAKEAHDAQRELADATDALSGMQNKLQGSLEKVNNDLQTHTQKLYDDQQATLLASGDKIAMGNAVADVGTKLESLQEQLVANFVAQDSSAQSAADAAQKQRDLASAVLATASAAAKQAVDNLGPNATAAEKMKAATDAQQGALEALYAQFPGLREQVQGYVGDLGTVPPSKSTSFDTPGLGEALSDVHAYRYALDGLDGRSVTVRVIAEKAGDAWAALSGI